MTLTVPIQPGGVAVGERKIHLLQGQFEVSDSPEVVLTTTLGSCVACCLHDPVRGVGGMNHFLLPHGEDASGSEARRYGAYAIEVLINGLLRKGADRRSLEGRLFGGARISDRLPDIGGQNAKFARDYLEHEGIRVMLRGSVGGRQARRIQFWPVSGRARQCLLAETTIFNAEANTAPSAAGSGTVEVFR
ncbi:chemotaxis protein CheD [uncultured Brevundimonas sp.]|uniref:chemotaxis protein CheD n=1 Tax=uncultured Brevundimonas sp. TaxID=213418 RepID=UPI0030EBACC4|tara:strand:- start:4269 stop:4838 length:570 start_codon:yes stop_codon:yes gene_type:complete